MSDKQIETGWGLVKVSGRLGQQHADVFESLVACAEKTAARRDSSGRLVERKLLIDPARVRDMSGQTSTGTFKQTLKELMAAVIEISAPSHLAGLGHLIDHVGPAIDRYGERITRANPLGGVRPLLTVRLGTAGLLFTERDEPSVARTKAISRLSHGVSQAIARLALTHNPSKQPNRGWRLDGLIDAVCGSDMSQTARRHRRREVREDTEALAHIGVLLVDGDRVRLAVQAGACSKSPEACSKSPAKRPSVQQKPGKSGVL